MNPALFTEHASTGVSCPLVHRVDRDADEVDA